MKTEYLPKLFLVVSLCTLCKITGGLTIKVVLLYFLENHSLEFHIIAVEKYLPQLMNTVYEAMMRTSILFVKNKRNILKDLDTLGINEESLFPEIEDVLK